MAQLEKNETGNDTEIKSDEIEFSEVESED